MNVRGPGDIAPVSVERYESYSDVSESHPCTLSHSTSGFCAEKALEEATLNLENSIKKRKVMDDRATKIIDDVKNMTNSLEK